MLKFDGAWRFDSPGEIAPGVVNGFFDLIGKIASQFESRYGAMEHFKQFFARAADQEYSKSSNLNWAESDLKDYMNRAGNNAPRFIEAFYDACESMRQQYRDITVPDVARINKVLSENQAGYEVTPPDLIPLNPQPPAPTSIEPANHETAVGKAVIENETQLALDTATLSLLIDEKLSSLRAQRPNSPEAQRDHNDQIAEYERLQAQLEQLRVAIDSFINLAKEGVLVKAGLTFGEGVQSWWTRSHQRICESAFNMAMFVGAVCICNLIGAGGYLTAGIVGVLAGGKPVTEAIKELAKGVTKSSPEP